MRCCDLRRRYGKLSFAILSLICDCCREGDGAVGSIKVLAASAAVVALALSLAGCAGASAGQHGRAPAGQQAGLGRSAKEARATSAGPVVAPAGSAAEAEQLGLRMLAGVILPAGSKQQPPRMAQTYQLRRYGHNDLRGLTAVAPWRIYRLPMPMAGAIAYLEAHWPAGVGNPPGWGRYLGAGDTTTGEYLIAFEQLLPVGLAEAELDYLVVPWHGNSSLLEVDGLVIWYPPRPAAEDLVAASFRAVTVGGVVVSRHVPRDVQKTFTASHVVGQVVRLLDDMNVSITPATTCGLLGGNQGWVQLHPVARGAPPVQAQSGSCTGYQVYLGTKPEPTLWPGSKDKLYALIARLLGLPS